MACCSEYQDECKRVVTIDYLSKFIGDNIQNSSGIAVGVNLNALSSEKRRTDYCPTYDELIGNSLIPRWATGATPNLDRDGIDITSAYASNQLVRQSDLVVKYTRFKSFSVSSPNTDVEPCGGTENLSYVHKYNRNTKSMTACTPTTSYTRVDTVEVSDTANGEITWTPNCNWVSVDQSTLVATVSKQPATRTADRRCCTVTGKVTFRTTDHTDSTDVCQEELTGGWVFSATSYYDLTVTASTTSPVGCCGGEYGLNGTGYYFDRYFWKDICKREYRESPFDDRYGTESLTGSGGGSCISCTINGDSSIGSDGGTIQLTASESSAGGTYYTGGTFLPADCCNDTTNCCTGRSDSASVTLTWHGLSETRPFTQYCPDKESGCCPEQWVYQSDTCTASDCDGYGIETYYVYPGKKDAWGDCVADTSQPYRTETASTYCGDCPEPPGPATCCTAVAGENYIKEGTSTPGTCGYYKCDTGSQIISASSDSDWLTGVYSVSDPGCGPGSAYDGRFRADCAPNNTGKSRTATITVTTNCGDLTFTSTQNG